VFNNPLFFIDPSGHHKITAKSSWECGPDGALCSNGSINHQHSPDKVDEGTLSIYKANVTEFSGEMMYKLYQEFWSRYNGTEDQLRYDFDGNGMLSVFDFMFLILSYEFQPINNNIITEKFVADLTEAGRNWYGCSPDGEINGCSYAPLNGSTDSTILNWLGGLESARRRYRDGWGIEGASRGNNYLAYTVGNSMVQPYDSTWEYHTYNIAKWANLIPMFSESVYVDMRQAPRNKETTGISNTYDPSGANPFFIMTPNQYDYWKGK